MIKKCFIATLLAQTLLGTTYYVTQNGDGAADGSSLANAWSQSDFGTLANWSATDSASQIDPGDTVVFSGVITNALIRGSGTDGNYITLDFSDALCDMNGDANSKIQFNSKQYIFLHSATLTNGVNLLDSWIDLDYSDLNIVSNITSLRSGSSGMFDITDAYSNLLTHITVTNRFGHVLSSGEFAHGTIVRHSNFAGQYGTNDWNTDLIALTAATNVLIEYCNFWLGSEETSNGSVPHSDCIQISRNGNNDYPADWTIRNCTFNVSTNITPDAGGGHLQGIIAEDLLGYLTIDNNLFWAHDADEAGLLCNVKNWRDTNFVLNIRNNTFATDGTWKYLLCVGGLIGATNTVNGDVNVTNNIFWSQTYLDGAAAAPIYDYVLTGTTAYNNNWDYNYLAGYGRFADSATGSGDTMTNVGSNSITETNSSTLFVTVGSDFSLETGSSAIDAGANLSDAITVDITGATRTGTWDIGAYEFGAGAEPPAATGSTLRANTARIGAY